MFTSAKRRSSHIHTPTRSHPAEHISIFYVHVLNTRSHRYKCLSILWPVTDLNTYVSPCAYICPRLCGERRGGRVQSGFGIIISKYQKKRIILEIGTHSHPHVHLSGRYTLKNPVPRPFSQLFFGYRRGWLIFIYIYMKTYLCAL